MTTGAPARRPPVRTRGASVELPLSPSLVLAPTQEKITQDLRRIADEIRVRIHLAGMDAKDAWAKLEPKVKDFEHKFERATGDAADDLDELAAVLQRELRKLNDRLFKS